MARRKTAPATRTPRPRTAARTARAPRGPVVPWLTAERRREVAGVGLVALGVVTLVAFTSRGGTLTEWWLGILERLFGWGAVAAPFAVGGIGAWLLVDAFDGSADVPRRRPIGAGVLFASALGLAHLFGAAWQGVNTYTLAVMHAGGGWVGYAIGAVLTPALGTIPAAALLVVVAAVAGSFAAGLPVNDSAGMLASATRRSLVAAWALFGALTRSSRPAPASGEILIPADGTSDAEAVEVEITRDRSGDRPPPESTAPLAAMPNPHARADWKLPDVDQVLDATVEVERSPDEAETMARLIETTLAEFGIPVKVVKINTGPTITQFGLNPGYIERAGVRTRVTVRRIVALHNDLALALAASPIRILAPVPGRPYVGVEVPNIAKTVVTMRGVMQSESFRKILAAGGLPIALGRDTTGHPAAGDLTRMPHLLVAGATGAGKSVCINALICSLLLTYTPDRLKLVLVDPKRVEMTQYRGLPHLASPVVVEVERVVGVLQWAVREMDRRYRMFAEAGARNLEIYNRILADRREPPLPFLVIVIDELADLMMLAPEETERLITRLAQLARATGIHLVLATQRPSVDVVTGLIKANFPSRIAFAVSSGIDSRVILDTGGAEKLLGRGDMLYMASDDSKLRRLQGCYVADAEIDRLVQYWKFSARSEKSGAGATSAAVDGTELALGSPEPMIQPELWEQMVDPQAGALADARDPLWDEAVALIRQHRTASISFLQRKLRIGYARAGRLVDQLEAAGLIGPAGQSGSREVLAETDADVVEAADFKTRLDRVFGAADGGGGAAAEVDDLAEVPDGLEVPDGFEAEPGDDGEPPLRPWLPG